MLTVLSVSLSSGISLKGTDMKFGVSAGLFSTIIYRAMKLHDSCCTLISSPLLFVCHTERSSKLCLNDDILDAVINWFGEVIIQC